MQPCAAHLLSNTLLLVSILTILFSGPVSAEITPFPRLNIRPPIGLFNGSTYSRLPGTGTAPSTFNATALQSSALVTATAHLATYHDHIFPTLCPSGNSACLDTCQSYAEACADESSSWSWDRKAYQTSVAKQSDGGSMPVTTSYHIQTNDAKTFWSYSTSWMTYEETTEAAAAGAGSHGLTATVITDGDKTFTSSVFKTGIVTVTYIKSIPYAVGGTGKPVSTRTEHYNTFTWEQTSWYDFPVSRPTCSFSTWMSCKYSADCNKCTISGGTVQLLYFPTPRTKPGASETNIQTPTSAAAALETAVYKNFTMTSPSVYISFQTAYAVDECGSDVGQRYPGAILPMPLSDLSSVRGGYGTLYSSDPLNPAASHTPYLAAGPFNLADLEWPYPLSAYTNQLKYALGREIFSIVTSPYNPYLAVPKQIRSLDPAWQSCELDWEGLYDPPTALRPADVMAKPTLSEVEATYTSAGPVVVTSVPDATKGHFTVESEAGLASTTRATAEASTESAVAFTRTAISSNDEETLVNPSSELSLPSVVIDAPSSEKVIQASSTGQVDAVSTRMGSSSHEIASVDARPNPGHISPLTKADLASTLVGALIPAGSEVEDSKGLDGLKGSSTTATIDVDAIAPSSDDTVHSLAQTTQRSDVPGSSHRGQISPQPSRDGNVPAYETTAPTMPLTLGTYTYTAFLVDSSGKAVIGSQTMTAGGSPMSLKGGTVSMATNNDLLYAEDVTTSGTKASSRASQPASTPTSASPDSSIPRLVLTLGSHTYTAVQPSGTRYAVLNGQTFSIGQAVSVPGGKVSFDTDNGVVLFADPVTHTRPNATASATAASSGTTSIVQAVPSGPVPGATTARTTTAGASSCAAFEPRTLVVLGVALVFAFVS